MRARLLLSFAAAAFLTAAALVLSRPANASDFPDFTQTFTTRLEPGDNLIGWTGGHKLIERIWEEVLQIEAVWSWDPNSKRYRIAAPSMPYRLWTLRILEPGMGLMLRISGDEAVDWERPRKPAQGTVLLIEGNNLVTWLGRDDTPIDHVVKGLGMTFDSITIQSSNSSELESYDPATMESAESLPTVTFGDPIWVTTTMDTIWLQPTGVVPDIHFVAGTPQHIKDSVQSDMESVVQYFNEVWGLEADFTDVPILAAHIEGETAQLLWDLSALHQATFVSPFDAFVHPEAKDDSVQPRVVYGLSTHVHLNLSNWNQTSWHASIETHIAHEYSHVVQWQLGGAPERRAAVDALWINEGQAMWMQNAYAVAKGNTTWSQLEPLFQASYQEQVSSDRIGPYVGPYIVFARLIEDYGDESWTGLWRSAFSLTRGIGASEDCDARLWVASMERVYDLSLRELSDLILSSEQIDIDDLPHGSDSDDDPLAVCRRRITGLLVDPDDNPIADAELGAFRTSGGTTTPLTISGADGDFAVEARGDGIYHLQANIEGCWLYFAGEGASPFSEGAREIRVAGHDVIGVVFRVPRGLCEYQVSGVIRNSDGAAVERAWMTAWSDQGNSGREFLRRGPFEITVPKPGQYVLNVVVDSCFFYYKEGGATLNRDEATPITITDADVTGIEFVLPPNPAALCD